MRSHLLEGTVAHRRSRPVEYALRHEVYYLALDLDELDEVDARLRTLSRNRRNLLTFRDDDHWPDPTGDLRATVIDHLRTAGEDPTGWRITLVTNARVLGYVFNPASFYLCRDARRHPACGHRRGAQHAPASATSTRSVPRPPTGRFVRRWPRRSTSRRSSTWRAATRSTSTTRPATFGSRINERQGDAPLLATSLVLRRRPLTDRTVVRMLLRHPFVTHKTMALIHWHALRLWRRGIPFQRHGRVAVGPMSTRRSLDDGARQRHAVGRSDCRRPRRHCARRVGLAAASPDPGRAA